MLVFSLINDIFILFTKLLDQFSLAAKQLPDKAPI